MNDNTNQFKHDIKSIFETAINIMAEKYHNASLSNMDVVFLSKKSFKALKDSICKATEKGFQDEELNKTWNTKEEKVLNKTILENSLKEVNEGLFECIVFEKEGLVITNKNYYFFLNSVHEYNLEN